MALIKMQRNFESPHFSAMQLGDETMMQLCIQGLAHLLGCHGKILSNLYYILATLNPEEWEEFRGQTMRRYLIYIISLKYLLIYLILMMIYFTKQYAWNR